MESEFESMRRVHACLERREVTSKSGESIYLCSYCHLYFASLTEFQNHTTEAYHRRMNCICYEVTKGWPFNDGRFFQSKSDVVAQDIRIGFVDLKHTGNGLVKGKYMDQRLLSCWMQCETISQPHLQEQQQQVERPFGIATFRNFRDIFEAQLHPRIMKGAFCYICKSEMLPSKDLSTVIQLEEKKFFCAAESQWVHVFHTSCLILWILYHEKECEGKRSPPPLRCPKCYSHELFDCDQVEELRDLYWMERYGDEPPLGLRLGNAPVLLQPLEKTIRDIRLIPFYNCDSLRE